MRVLAVSASSPDARAIEEAANALRAGQIVVFPTETVYGLGALATSRDAVKRVFEVKGRPKTHPLIVHVRDQADAMRYAAEWPNLARELAAAFWPGPLTLVVPKSDLVPSEVTGGGSGVALRAPSHPVARALLAAVGEAIVAPSANRYQSISPTRAEHVLTSLGPSQPDLIVLDGGPCPSGIESTVVDVREGNARVLRPGALSIPALRAVAPSLQFIHTELVDEAARSSPGQGARHYAPTTPLTIARDRATALADVSALVTAGERVAVILFEPIRRDEREVGAVHVLPRGAEAAGAALYALLYELDKQKYVRICVEPPPSEPGWEAITDRLRRAALR